MIKTLTTLVVLYCLLRLLALFGRALRKNGPDIRAFYDRESGSFFHKKRNDGSLRVDKIPPRGKEETTSDTCGEYVEYKQIKDTE